MTGVPKWAKPSNMVAYTGLTVGLAELVLEPYHWSGGDDSWIVRLRNGYETYQTSKNPFDILNYDGANHGAPEILVAQLKQNAPGALLTIGASGIVSGVLKRFGL